MSGGILALLAAASVVAPPVNATFDYQIGGAYPPRAGVRIVDRDRTVTPAKGYYNVCYVNGFQTQSAEAKWWRAHHDDLLLRDAKGAYVVDGEWHEQLLDTSTAAKRAALAEIVGGWIDGCAAKGYDAVEPDNLDSYSRSKKRLTLSDNKAFARLLIARAHAAGLAIAQKNTAELRSEGPKLGFDFAIAEECQVYDECGVYTKPYKNRVFEVEYPDNGGRGNFARACRARGARVSVVYRDRDVVPRGRKGYVYDAC
jgi:hypothetical protein